MTDTPHYQTVRTISYSAKSYLASLGYCTVRVSPSPVPIDIIGWKGRDELVFVKVISSKEWKNPEKFQLRVKELAGLARSVPLKAEVELWTSVPGCWNRYRVFPGGICALSGRSA